MSALFYVNIYLKASFINEMSKTERKHILIDFFIILLSVAVAIYITKSGLAHSLIRLFGQFPHLESFISGLFFTSVFTTAPSIALLGEIAGHQNIFIASLFGALGALTGDLILLKFVEDRFRADVMILAGKKVRTKVSHFFRKKIFRLASFFIGALIIASPFPDELGISIIGMAKTKKIQFILFSYLANFAGILAIMTLANSL